MNRTALLRQLALMPLSGGASFAALRASVSADAPTVLNISAFPVDNAGTLYYAQQLGYFRDAGFDVHISNMASGTAATVAAVVGGSLDIGIGNVVTVAQARLRGIDVQFIAPAAIVMPATVTDQILVPKDSPIRTARDLSGKTVGLFGLKDLQQLALMSWIDQRQGDSKTVTYVEVPIPEMLPALAARRVDAVLLTEPFVTMGKESTRSLGSEFEGFSSSFMLVGWVASGPWLRSHAREGHSIAAVFRRASEWANTHQRQSADLLAAAAKANPAIFHTMARTQYGTTLDAAMVQPVIDVALRYDMLSGSIPANQLLWK